MTPPEMTPPGMTQPEKTQPDARKPFLDLPLPQLVAGAVAAATAAILSSQIGLLGTVVAVALHTGVDLLTRDLPRDTFAARWLAEIGVGVKQG
jgi:hypothetical protein